jgi:hypothetical protein
MARPGKVNTKRMDVVRFEAVLALLPTLSTRRTEVARAVLVDGSTYQEAADKFGGSRQDANKATVAVWDAYERYLATERAMIAGHEATLPKGWACVRLDAPAELIEQLREKLQVYQAEATAPADVSAGNGGKSGTRRKKTRPADGEPG